MLIIGLTGGIGSGKSTVAAMLAEAGAPVLDADQVGHTVYEPDSPVYSEVVRTFGDRILGPDGNIDRKRLGAIVFSDPQALKRLNEIVHPRIAERIRTMIKEIRAHGERLPIVVEAAVMIEAGWYKLADEIWLVEAPRELVTERLKRDRAMDDAQIEGRIKAQLSPEERRRHATLIIQNNGSLEDLRVQVGALWAQALRRNR